MGPNTTSHGPNRKMEVRNLNVQNVDNDYNGYLQNNDIDMRDITRLQVVDNR